MTKANVQNWKQLVVLLLTLLAAIGFMFISVYQSEATAAWRPLPVFLTSYRNKTDLTHQKKSVELKILWYKIPPYLMPHVNFFKTKPCDCSCSISTNVRDLAKSDVVIFTQYFLPAVPPKKEKHHVWCFNTMENRALTAKPGPLWKDKFQWIMSYRRSSDIFRPYGIIKKRGKKIERNYAEVFSKKNKVGVWMSGHCPVPSRRKSYVQELKRFMEVDMYGTCGTRICKTKSPFVGECIRNFSRDYKFYFSFENNICEDYTTEKLFNFFSHENLNIVPVVNGPATASEYLPKGAFINALEFPSPKELARRLNEIGSNENMYTQFLKEKDKFYSLTEIEIFRETMCNICKKIEKGGRKIPNRADFWNDHFKNKC
ncbi:alpha-(1,3)-fucosyltransferase C-like [Ostrea edulis]|uniref:alpha-(1,3)-fucosyltransferase C-like n=1 Tax=Ostrea edulis TaxID=37623 RepID=UPI00209517B2|nr:alpha-(1,3)-fucosyltransferase C-like [Ostrea edulis]